MTARAEVGRLLDRLGRSTAQEIGSLSPVHRPVVASLATLIRLGYPCEGDYLAEHARLMRQVAVREPDMMETYPTGRRRSPPGGSGSEPYVFGARQAEGPSPE
ncbi:hypothetical protein [Streptomyces sp. NPDC088727]|uniref:hypothetical protein n=1 Tax=Streptomyces sp. NPDC088727 TaxID=3365875 RepID=UPI00381AA6E2